ncbi:MAG: hypothetical protein WCK48_02870 [bacterium]
MSFLNLLNVGIIKAQDALKGDTSEKVAAIRKANQEKAAIEAANILKQVTAGTTRLADVKTSTETIMRALFGLVAANVAAVLAFVAKFPNRLYVGNIPEVVKTTGKRDELGAIYLGRVLSPEFGPTWVRPDWLEEGEDDANEFWFAVSSLFAAMLGAGAEPRQFRFVAGALETAYADRLASATDQRLWKLLEAVRNTGTYHVPGDNPHQQHAPAANGKGHGHNNGQQQRRRDVPNVPERHFAPECSRPPASEASASEVEAYRAGLNAAHAAKAPLAEHLATKGVTVNVTVAPPPKKVRKPRSKKETATETAAQ